MGQKINPVGFRLGVIQSGRQLVLPRDFAGYLDEDRVAGPTSPQAEPRRAVGHPPEEDQAKLRSTSSPPVRARDRQERLEVDALRRELNRLTGKRSR